MDMDNPVAKRAAIVTDSSWQTEPQRQMAALLAQLAGQPFVIAQL
jgi:hypothetical protein